MRLRDFASSTATALAVLLVAFLAYVAGAWAAWLGNFPFDPMLRRAFIGAAAVLPEYLDDKDPYDSDVWMKARDRPTGVVAHQPHRAHDGHTLVTSGQGARLLDMDGSIVHEWSLPYGDIEELTDRASIAFPDDWIYWRPARLLPNGDLIAIVDAWASTPEGLALIKIDRNSRILWIYRDHVHHDFDMDEAGNVFVLSQEIRQEAPSELSALDEPLLDEFVVLLSPEGEEVRRVSIMDAFAKSPYRTIVNRLAPTNVDRRGDYLHNNNVELLTAEHAAVFPFLEPGQVILSMRELDTIAALDLDEEQIVWAMRGPWHRQHDPDLLANGNILLFDNKGDWARGGRSRVIEFDPKSGEIVWAWPSAAGGELWSAYRAEQQRLPNGNVLINEFAQGRLLEVTRDGEVVWEFVSPFRHERHAERVARIMFAERYPKDWIAFEPVATTAARPQSNGDRG